MRTIKSQFRYSAGYDKEHLCRDCEFCVRRQCGARAHYKCTKMGTSASAATDIRLKDIACKWFVKKGVGNE